MTNSFYKILVIIIICKVVISCQEIYTPDDLDDDKNILVIEGGITNRPGPYGVKLKWAAPYNSTYEIPIRKAIVRISDDKGNEEILSETEPGKYTTMSGGITGTVGNTYTLTVDLPDGSQYVSKPGTLKSVPEISNIYASIGLDEVVGRTSAGEIYISEFEGLNVFLDINSKSEQPCFYRFAASYFIQNKYVGVTGGSEPEQLTVLCIEHDNMIDLPNVKAALYNGRTYEVRQYKIGFLPYYSYNSSHAGDTNSAPYILDWISPLGATSSSLDNLSAPYHSGWVTAINIYSINEDVYNYYKSVADQLSATDYIFDPIPTQIESNFICTSDSSKFALGIFEVTSFNSYYTAFFWDGAGDLQKKMLEDYNWISSDMCVANTYPDYWVNP